jgi:hypothetical protein
MLRRYRLLVMVAAVLTVLAAGCSNPAKPSGVNLPHSGTPPYMTRSPSSTPSAASSGSTGVGLPAASSASIRWISASCAWRRRRTHLHGDHFGGLPFLILDGQFAHRSAPLLVAGPPGIRARLTEAMETLFPGSSRVRRRFPVEVTELATDGTPTALGAATVRGWEVEHACGAPPLALRVGLGGVTFAYSGDTQWTPALAEAAREADLFAAEAYTFDRPIRYHLDYQTLRAHLQDIDAARVVLTHMSADMLGRLADAELPAAYDGMIIDL